MAKTTGMHKPALLFAIAMSVALSQAASVTSATAQGIPKPPTEVMEIVSPPPVVSEIPNPADTNTEVQDFSTWSPEPAKPEVVEPGALSVNDFVHENLEPTVQSYELYDLQPAITESTSTNLRRGWWYSSVDLVLMTRQWNRNGVILAVDRDLDSSGSLDGGSFGGGGALDDGDTSRQLVIKQSHPGREESARLRLGRFLYRDGSNRDHNIEFTLFGGGEFSSTASIFSDNPQGANLGSSLSGRVHILSSVDGGSDISFDGAESASFRYDSRFNSFELNYILSSRMRKDRMVMLPSGEWVRRSNPGFTHSMSAGLRYFDLTENLQFNGNAIDNTAFNAGGATGTDTNINGEYLVRTSNDLFGFQLGGSLAYESDKFSITVTGKGGVLGNDAKSRSSLNFLQQDGTALTEVGTGTNVADPNFFKSNRTQTLPFLIQAGIIGRYNIRPNVSFRTGYNMMYVTSVALAPHQLDFVPENGVVAATGDVFYHGISSGLEFYW